MKVKAPRKVLRFPTKLEVHKINDGPGTGTFILDISALGLKLETPVPFMQRDLVGIKFRMPGESEEVHLAGQVAWIKPMMTPPPRYIVGLKLFLPQWQIYRLGRQWTGFKQMP